MAEKRAWIDHKNIAIWPLKISTNLKYKWLILLNFFGFSREFQETQELFQNGTYCRKSGL